MINVTKPYYHTTWLTPNSSSVTPGWEFGGSFGVVTDDQNNDYLRVKLALRIPNSFVQSI